MSVAPSGLQVRGAPTLVLLDRTGTVRQLLTGQLEQEAQTRLLRALSAVGS